MKPEFNSHRLFGITRSKGKMYELGLPESLHIEVPSDCKPDELFLLTIGTLGDAAASIATEVNEARFSPEMAKELSFSASYFDAFLASRFSESISHDVMLLAASAYYLAHRPGSSLVLSRKLDIEEREVAVDRLLRWVLQAKWQDFPNDSHPLFGNALGGIAKLLAFHFHEGSGLSELESSLQALRHQAYNGSSARELLFVDIISAIIRMRLSVSTWTTLPQFTQIAKEQWEQVIRRPEFPKELWPSQMLLGQAGFYAGSSGIVQMPTSAGKTRSVEIVLRSGFLSGRTKLAVVVAPFKALCHEIATSLRKAFRQDDVKINEMTDALQLDFREQIAELLGVETPLSQYILVLTPEKFLYVLRQTPDIFENLGIVVYDEGHQFDSGSRGITYELLLTEIKELLPADAQTILISAVIQNAQEMGQWLIGDKASIVNGNGLLPTSRSVAFASWVERLGQLMFFESDNYSKADYFVPRVINSQELKKVGRERKRRYFPEKGDTNDISLYLGIRLVAQGAVAIFCGRKDTAAKMAYRAVEAYDRGLSLPSPDKYASADELERLKNLISGHLGDQSIMVRAAEIGIFTHHGNTPHGLRISIEHAMQEGKIRFVSCTSTLAQGVNLPIRYLIVSSIYQAGEKVKVRDFQNLVGRAGRAGMHTEGLVIFADSDVYDNRKSVRWKFRASVELLSPDKSEDISSSLLGLLSPFESQDGRATESVTADTLCYILLEGSEKWQEWASNVVDQNPQYRFDAKHLVAQLQQRRRLIHAIESYLMANRGTCTFEDFRLEVEHLASTTLAYHLAPDAQKPDLLKLFGSVAEYIQSKAPDQQRQHAYAKTLLGVKSAVEIQQWTEANWSSLLSAESQEDWLALIWPLFEQQLDSRWFNTINPDTLTFQLTTLWIQGSPYKELFEHNKTQEGSKPWGEMKRRSITEDDIIDFCENTLGFDCALVLAAVAQFLFGESTDNDKGSAGLALFQKSLKYGLPDILSISCFEYGFSDRVLAQDLCNRMRSNGFSGNSFRAAIKPYYEEIAEALTNYPSYFETVLMSRSK